MIPATCYIYPTDTVWGIGGTLASWDLYQQISQIKRTAPNKPVSILFPSLAQLSQYIELPTEVPNSKWERFFTLETTLALPIQRIINHQIPGWIYQDSPLICLRLLSYPWIQTLSQLCQGPIITTSLNLHGAPPIIDADAAKAFWLQECPHAQVVGPWEHVHSGHSSSIVVWDQESAKINFLRTGRYQQEILNLFTPL